MSKFKIVGVGFILLILISCFGVKTVKSDAKPIKHDKWDKLLQKHVTNDGCVDYKGFIKDSLELNEYLNQLSTHHPSEKWSKNERFAYWINAYNAFTIKIVIKNYPLESIKDIGGSVYRINTTWAIKFINIGEQTYSLDNIEHDILRPKFKDARVHVAVNCASESCPPLYNHSFEADKIDSQLDEIFKAFLKDTERNKITKDKIEISKIFKWFSGDFKRDASSIVEYLNKYAPIKINDDAEVEYLDYLWGLNEC